MCHKNNYFLLKKCMHCLYTKVRQNYFPFEHLSAVYIKQWEEVEKVLSNKAEKSQKRKKNRERGFKWGIIKIVNPHYEKDNSEFLTEGLIEEMKKMSPQYLMNILMPTEDTQELRNLLY